MKTRTSQMLNYENKNDTESVPTEAGGETIILWYHHPFLVPLL